MFIENVQLLSADFLDFFFFSFKLGHVRNVSLDFTLVDLKTVYPEYGALTGNW